MLILVFTASGGLRQKNRWSIQDEGITERLLYTHYTVFRGNITNHISKSGIVVPSKDSLKQIAIDTSNTKPDIKFVVGDRFSIGDVLYTMGDREFTSKDNGWISQIIHNKNRTIIEYIDFSDYYIYTFITQDEERLINQGTQVKIIGSNDLILDGEIIYISPEIFDGELEVKIRYQGDFLPGSQVKLNFILEERKDVKLIEKEVLKRDERGTYLEKLSEEGLITRVYIDVGIEDENYIEILSNNVNLGDEFILITNEFDGARYLEQLP